MAIVMNAQDLVLPARRSARLKQESSAFSALGLAPEELDLRQYFGAPELLRSRLTQYGLIWVRGGNVFVLRRAFEASGFDAILTDMLKRDEVVYGGFSAGACVLAPGLQGLELVDDSFSIPLGYPRRANITGLGILPFALAPHYRSEHPEAQLIDSVVEYYIDHHARFVALRDGEVLLIQSNGTSILDRNGLVVAA